MNADQHTPVALCRTCGEPVNERDRFCEECGRPDPTTPRTPPLGTALPHASPTPASRAAPFAPNPVPRQREQPPSAPQADPGEGTAAGGACVDCGVGAVGADGYCEQCGLRQPSGREHVEAEAGRSGAAVSDLGLRRSRNEDAFALAELPAGVCAVVCDGVATAPGSEEASRLAAEAALAVLTGRVPAGADPRGAMRDAAARAGEVVAGLPGDPDSSPACTFVSAVVDAGGITVGWVGDSRAYWLSPAGSCRLTTDDSWASSMIEQGAMSAEEAWADRRAHVLTAWLGADAGPLDPHVAAFRPTGPGLVVLCSDGLWNDLPEPSDLAAVALTGRDGPLDAARRLVRAALDAGGHDNVTVAVLRYPPPGPSRERGR
ncbi:serine/threonine protein phosphatase PrpC [Actinomadura luteofluorescens]|uniref:Serine/threonine protein phosphatase PrpC n=1 Tax=Actinomadura luteofluorescens TaxID=46163 RepID=A0A7Y9EHV1_9ACTN|nr:PP2C family serine/threonine-protein phosphatase [Actinomadura luteofluorescens]NYD47984.1 serine/threonine protein phosphatase PrpC [Actinomadura luteofluorescens]